MNDNYTYGRTSTYHITYHIMWCTMYRQTVLTPQIAQELIEILKETGKEKEFDVLAIEVKDSNYIDCIITAPPKLSITQVVKYCKGISGRLLLRKYPGIGAELWNGSYFCETLGDMSPHEAQRYIERQKHCQL